MSDPKCTLLVVDDERYILTTLTRLLQQDFDVVTAESCEEGMEVFAHHKVDLLLCDQKMPRMSGVQLLEWVRQNHPKTVRLLMTGFAELEDLVEAINRGHIYRFLVKPWRSDELLQVLRDAAKVFALERNHDRLLEELRRVNDELEKRVQQRTLELEEANRQLSQKNAMLERLALTDELTGLPNRRAIENFLAGEIRRRSRYQSPLAVGLVDADRFKDINTRYLYPGGDQVLIRLAKVLTGSLRAVDAVGRVGGEEFLVIAPETDLEGAHALSERIRHAVEETEVWYEGEPIRVTVSVGFTVADEKEMPDLSRLIHRAAAALQEAKARGRNCSVVLAITPDGAPTASEAVASPETYGSHH